MADLSELSPSERLAKMIARDNKKLLDMAVETDKMVSDTIDKSLRNGIKKISESFEQEIEKIRSNIEIN